MYYFACSILYEFLDDSMPNSIPGRLSLSDFCAGPPGGSIHIENVVDIREETNLELGMRVRGLDNTGSYFYTDLNGFQVLAHQQLERAESLVSITSCHVA